MNFTVNAESYCYDGSKRLNIVDTQTHVAPLYNNKISFDEWTETYRAEIDKLQSMLFAHGCYGLLIIFQGLDAAGKDSTIKHIVSGINPMGVNVVSFKKPNSAEIYHDFLWRCTSQFPQRGELVIFNRSYYEEVLVVKVHPDVYLTAQNLPPEPVMTSERLFQNRYIDIVNLEQYAYRNGIHILKFFLNVSPEEQTKRMIERIERPEKKWKFDESDIVERKYRASYLNAYEECIQNTATVNSPWFIIPADDKKNMKLIVGGIILDKLKMLHHDFPQISKSRAKNFQKIKQTLMEQLRKVPKKI